MLSILLLNPMIVYASFSKTWGEVPKFVDDDFQTGWERHDGIGTFEVLDENGDYYLRQTVTEPATSYRIKREGLSISTNIYKLLKVRVRGGGNGVPQFQVSFSDSDGYAFGHTGWHDAGSDFEEYVFEIPENRTITGIYLWVSDKNHAASCYVDWDYVAIVSTTAFGFSRYILMSGISLFFIPIAVMAYFRPDAPTIIKLLMVMVLGLALLMASVEVR